jgi:hypothetical protein
MVTASTEADLIAAAELRFLTTQQRLQRCTDPLR